MNEARTILNFLIIIAVVLTLIPGIEIFWIFPPFIPIGIWVANFIALLILLFRFKKFKPLIFRLTLLFVIISVKYYYLYIQFNGFKNL